MVSILVEISTDTEFEVDNDNPLRQVIINTHSPLVVSKVSDESLYLATENEKYSEEFMRKIKFTKFSALKHTWKTISNLSDITTLGEIKFYLENFQHYTEIEVAESQEKNMKKRLDSKLKLKTVSENIASQLDMFSNAK